MKTKLFFGLMLLLTTSFAVTGKAQTSSVSKMVSDKAFVFTATNVLPQGGGQRYVGGDGYTLKVNRDSLQSDLPYIGRSTSAPMNPSDIGMKFISTDFTYEIEPSKKDRNQITIKPRDVIGVQEIFITVFSNGSADIRISSVNRQPVSYRGEIKAIAAR